MIFFFSVSYTISQLVTDVLLPVLVSYEPQRRKPDVLKHQTLGEWTQLFETICTDASLVVRTKMRQHAYAKRKCLLIRGS